MTDTATACSAFSTAPRPRLPRRQAVIDIGGQSISAHDHLEGVLPIPTLIVWGSKDRMIPAWHELSVQRAVPGCHVELFEARITSRTSTTQTALRVLREFITASATQEQPTAGDDGSSRLPLGSGG